MNMTLQKMILQHIMVEILTAELTKTEQAKPPIKDRGLKNA